MKTVRDLEAVQFCGEVYLFKQTPSAWVMERHGGAVSITYMKLPGENRDEFNKRLRANEKEIEDKHCMDCTESLCSTTSGECWLYRKNKVESEK